MSRALVAAVLLAATVAGCAPAAPLVTRPSSCDFRALDLNRRLCAERGGVFIEVGPCGTCGLR